MNKLNQLRDLIQNDIGKRGLRTDPVHNLVSACPDDFAAACKSLAEHPQPSLAVVTGFFIPTATPPAGETDGPLGALFLARALVPLGIPVTLITDDFCIRSLEVGLEECGLRDDVPLVTLPTNAQANKMSDEAYVAAVAGFSHLLAIERVGPSHSHEDGQAQNRNRCHTMRGRDITDLMSPAHRLFEPAWRAESRERPGGVTPDSVSLESATRPLTGLGSPGAQTIGIGDGGNEIGMGKIAWDVIARNIPGGGLVACRVPTQHLIVCGGSNWGAYALAAGVALLRDKALEARLFDPQRERDILKRMVEMGGLVDGVLAKPSVTVDGLTWEQYADVLVRIATIVV